MFFKLISIKTVYFKHPFVNHSCVFCCFFGQCCADQPETGSTQYTIHYTLYKKHHTITLSQLHHKL